MALLNHLSQLMRSGPVLSLTAKCPHSGVFFTTSSFWSLILHVTFPQTTHSYRIKSSYFDQIVYTLLPYASLFLFKSFKNCEGPEKDVAPGKNPSFVPQVGKTLEVQHAVNPKFAPANPMNTFTLSLRLFPTWYVPAAWSIADPPFTICLAIVTPIECPIIFTFFAPVYAITASTKVRILITHSFLCQFWDAWFGSAGPHVVVYN